MTPDALRPRLAKVLGLLGSEHDGEVLAAARAASRLVREAGLTWEQVLAGPAPNAAAYREPWPSEAEFAAARRRAPPAAEPPSSASFSFQAALAAFERLSKKLKRHAITMVLTRCRLSPDDRQFLMEQSVALGKRGGPPMDQVDTHRVVRLWHGHITGQGAFV